ncbi:hypothetical protein Pyn_29443 [Prunus yedoensis var. nudiflora]|uniref:Uncharacterized protein n=1 Tax=Prunus yedoensis var. nudiflora TaxID=2094558 RepID=A0A314UNG6_PRUYE|nr:hypothetical protein Pyn_29443 [Prunus yedoensis var. nudiflora]
MKESVHQMEPIMEARVNAIFVQTSEQEQQVAIILSTQQFDNMLQIMREGFSRIQESLSGLNQNQNNAITMAVEASYNKAAELLEPKSISPRTESVSLQAIAAPTESLILFQGQPSVVRILFRALHCLFCQILSQSWV